MYLIFNRHLISSTDFIIEHTQVRNCTSYAVIERETTQTRAQYSVIKERMILVTNHTRLLHVYRKKNRKSDKWTLFSAWLNIKIVDENIEPKAS